MDFDQIQMLNSSWAKHNDLNLKGQNLNPLPQILILQSVGLTQLSLKW